MVQAEILILGLLLLVAIAGAISLVMRSVKYLAVNALFGLVILYLANAFAGLAIPYSPPVLLVCAVLGAPGAIAVIILNLLGLGF
ncbi:pro-sigmaK processing inhibitor BofA family protein [Candidatus Methanocrinis natronophilus]|uniref:Pro-sigmaK processing inhibitor BofA family protein n=1 Tax=Candidatus Methanocrinis natronophilus TaxID=3033396 RepID=A0ABT5X771_9EURY|nr:pro-sigmaK processing inhibitor BofA family protein [Candidatus Methanocrinis natronophilus]MDF0590503.1 pro-sigmaK processing inhibitor BofA family protein [Candidatus Methanocrinis natronophilus]